MSDKAPDNFMQMMIDVHRDMGDTKREMGEITGTVKAIHERLDSMIDAEDKRHKALDKAVNKNTNFRHYVKGAIAVILVFCGYISWKVSNIWENIQHVLGDNS